MKSFSDSEIPVIAGGDLIRKDDFLIFGKPIIQKEDIDEVNEVLKTGWVSTGPKAKQFEEEFASYNGMKYAISTNSCTAALHLSLECLDLPKDSEVIVPDMTFVATVNAVIHAGLKPVIVDCRKDDCNILEEDLERKITNKTKAIMPVHFAGYPFNIDFVKKICEDRGIHFLSDCAHAVESKYNGVSVAQHCEISSYSFYPNKSICCIEGGIALTNDENYAKKMKIMSLHGMSKDAYMRFGKNGYKHYSVDQLGYKYNFPDVNAALGINQLRRIGKTRSKRKDIWKKYCDAFVDLPVVLPVHNDINREHAHHLFTVFVELEKLSVDRDFLLNALSMEKIGVGVHYLAVHRHPYYKNTFSIFDEDFPNSSWVSDRTISLPINPEMSEKDVDDVIGVFSRLLRYYEK